MRDRWMRDLIRYVNITQREEAVLDALATDDDVKNLFETLHTQGKSQEGWAVIHWAACRGKLEILKSLVDAGSYLAGASLSLKVRTAAGTSLVGLAAMGGSIPTLRYLKDKGLDLKRLNKDGKSALHLAGNVETVKYLISERLTVDSIDINGWSPLHHSAAIADVLSVEYYLSLGLDLWALTKQGTSLLHLAAQSGRISFFKKMLKKGFDVRAVDCKGASVLMYAVNRGRTAMMAYLIEKYGFEFPADHDWVLKIANNSGNPECVAFYENRSKELYYLAKYCLAMLSKGKSDILDPGFVEKLRKVRDQFFDYPTFAEGLKPTLEKSVAFLVVSIRMNVENWQVLYEIFHILTDLHPQCIPQLEACNVAIVMDYFRLMNSEDSVKQKVALEGLETFVKKLSTNQIKRDLHYSGSFRRAEQCLDHYYSSLCQDLLRKIQKNDQSAFRELQNLAKHRTEAVVTLGAYYESQAESNLSRLQGCMGFVRGLTAVSYFKKAVECYEKGVQAGDSEACYRMSALYQKGHGVEKNPSKAIELSDTALALQKARGSIGSVIWAPGFREKETEARPSVLSQVFDVPAQVDASILQPGSKKGPNVTSIYASRPERSADNSNNDDGNEMLVLRLYNAK